MLSARVLTADGRNTVQGTFDDLSEEEKTRAYLQFLQYHQQLEQENETKRFQQMLNRKQTSTYDDEAPTENPKEEEEANDGDDDSLRVWYGLNNSSRNRSSSTLGPLMMIFTMMMVFQF